MNAMTQMSLQERELLGALVGLARAMDENTESPAAQAAIVSGLCSLASGGSPEALALARQQKRLTVPDCFSCHNPCGRTSDWNSAELALLEPPVRQAKEALLAAMVRLAQASDGKSPQALHLLTDGLFSLGYQWFTREEIEEKIQALEKETAI